MLYKRSFVNKIINNQSTACPYVDSFRKEEKSCRDIYSILCTV